MSDATPPEVQVSRAEALVRRDRAGRLVARALGAAAAAIGVAMAPFANSVPRAIGILAVTISFCAYMFHMARTVPGAAKDPSEEEE